MTQSFGGALNWILIVFSIFFAYFRINIEKFHFPIGTVPKGTGPGRESRESRESRVGRELTWICLPFENPLIFQRGHISVTDFFPFIIYGKKKISVNPNVNAKGTR